LFPFTLTPSCPCPPQIRTPAHVSHVRLSPLLDKCPDSGQRLLAAIRPNLLPQSQLLFNLSHSRLTLLRSSLPSSRFTALLLVGAKSETAPSPHSLGCGEEASGFPLFFSGLPFFSVFVFVLSQPFFPPVAPSPTGGSFIGRRGLSVPR